MHYTSATNELDTVGCIEPGCFELATIRVRVGDRVAVLCPLHWNQGRRDFSDTLHVEAELPRPCCFKVTCSDNAVSGMTHLDGRCLPVCETHLEDLSWVTPSVEDLAALGVRDD